MNDRPSVHDDSAPADDETARAAVGPRPDAGEDARKSADPTGVEESKEKPFGEQEPTRFASDVEYSGRAGGHDYLVRVRHRLLDSSFTVVIDGIEHDPAAEEKAREKTKEKAGQKAGQKAAREAAQNAEAGTDADDRAGTDGRADDQVDGDASDDAGSAGRASSDDDAGSDDLRFRLGESFTVVHCTVRRRVQDGGRDGDVDGGEDDGNKDAGDEDGGEGDGDTGHQDAEVISVRTAGLGGAGEVDVRHGLVKTLLVPAAGSPSAVRDEKRIAHPARYAMLSALAKAAGLLIPLLGLSGLFSGLFDPIEEWVEARVRPLIDAISQATEPVRTWFDELMRPVTEFFDALFAPIRSAIAAVLRPIGEAWNWLTDLLFGWIPDFSLPFSVPEWVVDAALPVMVVLIAFLVTFGSLRHRREKLDATRAATQAHAGKAADGKGSVGEGDAAGSTVPAGHGATEDSEKAPSDPSSTEPVRPQR